MNLWRYVSSYLYGEQPSFCQNDFPKVYEGFIDTLVDTLHAQGPAVSEQTSQAFTDPPLRLPAVDRLIAIGDLHGDFDKTRRVFRLANLIDDRDRWCGGTTTAVQVGDQLDRGGEEVRILYFLERLQKEAALQGGALHILNGNHETMNVAGKFRYCTPQGLADFAGWTFMQGIATAMKASCGCKVGPNPLVADDQPPLQSRISALSPGGPVARRFLAPHPVALQVGSTMFVHGGILPQHAAYGLERMNQETRSWMLGQAGKEMPRFLAGRDAVVWTRDYSTEEARRCNCAGLEAALKMLPGAKRMVVGHTIQQDGINAACDNKVFRIDVGLSSGCGNGDPEVLEILKDSEIRSLRESKEAKNFTREATISSSRWWPWKDSQTQHQPAELLES